MPALGKSSDGRTLKVSNFFTRMDLISALFHTQRPPTQQYCCGNQKTAQGGGPGLMSQCMVRNLASNRSLFHECGEFDVYAEINGPRPVIQPKKRRGLPSAVLRPGLLLDDGTLDHASYEGHRAAGSKVHRIFFPQYFNIQDIHDHYPNATFILNTRPFDSWIKSVQDWGDDLDWQFVNEFYQRGVLEYLPNDRRNHTEMAEIMREVYDLHHKRVRQFVKEHPSHTLVEVPILHPNASEILGQAFGLNSSAWGRHNSKENRDTQTTVFHELLFLENWFLEWLDNPIIALSVGFGMTSLAIYWILTMTASVARLQREKRQRREMKAWRK
jgi:Sulfotransferase domain